MKTVIAKLPSRTLYLLAPLLPIPVIAGIVCFTEQPLVASVALTALAVGAAGYIYKRWSLMDLCYLTMIGAVLREGIGTRWGFQMAGDLLFMLPLGFTILCWSVAAIRGTIPHPLRGNGLSVSLLVIFFVGWSSLTYFISVDRAHTLHGAMALPLVMLWGHWVIPSAITQKKDAERTLRFFVYIVAALVIFNTLTAIVPVKVAEYRLGWTGWKDWETRFVGEEKLETLVANPVLPLGWLSAPNIMAALLMLGMAPILYFLFSAQKRWTRISLSLLLVSVVMYLILSGSRASLGAGMISGLVIAYLHSKRAFVYTALIVLLVGVIFLGTIYVAASQFGLMIRGHMIVTKFFTGRTMSGRPEIWQGAVNNIKQRPWLGWGLSAAGPMRQRDLLLPGFGTAHNVYLRLGEETGLPTAVCMLVYMVFLFTASWRICARQPSRRLLGATFLAIFVGIFVHQMFTSHTMLSRFGANGISMVFLAGSVLSLASLPPKEDNQNQEPSAAQSASPIG